MDGQLRQVFKYVYEYHGQGEYIPYRPQDRGSLTIMYSAPFGLELSLSGEFYGTRYVDTKGAGTLSSYSLLKPRISKASGKYAVLFIEAEFYIGQDEYQIWRDYELPSKMVNFGLTLKF